MLKRQTSREKNETHTSPPLNPLRRIQNQGRPPSLRRPSLVALLTGRTGDICEWRLTISQRQ